MLPVMLLWLLQWPLPRAFWVNPLLLNQMREVVHRNKCVAIHRRTSINIQVGPYKNSETYEGWLEEDSGKRLSGCTVLIALEFYRSEEHTSELQSRGHL